ncbi:hypothetical protein A5773_04250 [Mycobacterium sp. 852014-52450_SCH5900713]|uniref:hypothetical protein n=1 Tax=Mycobacterium sp. 852014-52450_SCH5900713 TaxID=1834116 RepID=UPI000802085E|nr:hypothetical protein [Mycobacterium sp. 852014-52450_SCH5900713]OBG00706.1 hypothetical protein A5773_04250 [Mycobacterium sp. 852014-52450_SCH5900713]
MVKRSGDSPPDPQRGDVERVDYADPDPLAGKRSGPFQRVPEPDERVAIRLVGHPFTYAVRISTSRSGPRLTELTITADDGATVDYAVVRAVPTRRLAYSAAQWIDRAGGLFGFVDDIAETHSQPDNPAPKVYEAAQIANNAIALGLPVRPTVAEKLNISKTTVDRLLKRARAEGWFNDEPLPKRPQPQQRDTTATTDQETDR